jgi:hypothetical protein
LQGQEARGLRAPGDLLEKGLEYLCALPRRMSRYYAKNIFSKFKINFVINLSRKKP